MDKNPFVLVGLASLLILTGCSSSSNDSTDSSSSGTVQAFSLPSTMSIVTAAEDSSSSVAIASAGKRRFTIKAFNDPDTDFSTDPVNTYVYDASMQSLNTVNMILCLVSQTGASEMLNQGDYIALVNEDLCEQGQNQSSAGQTGQSSGGQATQYNAWTVNSSRNSEDAPQIVRVWVPGDEPDPASPDGALDAQTILVEITQTAGPTANNPFGEFTMNFRGVVDSGVLGGPSGTEVETMRGTLQAITTAGGLPQFRFINLGGDSLENTSGLDFQFEEAVSVVLNDAEGNSGRALARDSATFDDGSGAQTSSQTYAVDLNTSHLFRGRDTDGDNIADEQQCLSRTSFDTNVWRYNLYHRDDGSFNDVSVVEGERVAVNNGFPFEYDSDNDGSDDAYGYVGYWGLWTETGMLSDGSTINKFDFVTGNSTPMTVNLAPGKMIRRTTNNEALSGLQGDEFFYWDQHPTLNIFAQFIISVDSSNDFNITGVATWGESGPQVSTTIDHDDNPGTSEVNVAATLSFSDGDNLWLWSEALGGNIVYVHDSSVAANNRQVTFFGEDFVNPNDAIFNSGPVTLFCYDQCVQGGLTQSDVDSAVSLDDLFHTYSGTPFQYTLTASNGKVTLTDNTNAGAAVDATNLDLSALGFDWGINTGEMVTATIATPSEPWRVFEEDTTYRWETGPNDYNRQVTVSDSQNVVSTFDPPLRFTYTHSTANDANSDSSQDGKKFLLEYNGPGGLHGFPWVLDPNNGRWHAAVTLADGANLTDGTNNFVVKGIEKEQSMQAVSASACSTLDVGAVFSDSNLQLLTLSDIGNVSITLAGKPNVTAAPAVIEGELQNTADE